MKLIYGQLGLTQKSTDLLTAVHHFGKAELTKVATLCAVITLIDLRIF
jgi:hypothetical protein